VCPNCNFLTANPIFDAADAVCIQRYGLEKDALEEVIMHYSRQKWVNKIQPTVASMKRMMFLMAARREHWGKEKHMKLCFDAYLACHVTGLVLTKAEAAVVRQTFHNVWAKYDGSAAKKLADFRTEFCKMMVTYAADLLDGYVLMKRNISTGWALRHITTALKDKQGEDLIEFKKSFAKDLVRMHVLVLDTSTNVTLHVKRPRDEKAVATSNANSSADQTF